MSQNYGPKCIGVAAADQLVSVTGGTVTITEASHAGRVVALNRAAGVTATLPAATGSGNSYRFVVGTTVTSNNDILQVANATDYLRGFALMATDATDGSAPDAWVTASTGTVATESDTMTLNGSTKGGVIGDWIEVIDIASAVWLVRARLKGSGTEATPFSAAV